MNALLFWFVLGQALLGGHTMLPGTVVKLADTDLMPVYASAVVEEGQLVFTHAFEPETEVRLLFLPPGSSESELAPYGRVGPTGDDIFIRFEGAEQAVSLRRWLLESYDIELVFAPPEE